MTGEPFVDAGMRELYVTGTMHNRVRMIVGSYLTKHLRLDWRIGKKWFEECLIDWDPAANAMVWQWIAGCGPDAAPYFRVFNPATQAEKFDKSQEYRGRFLNNWLLHSEPEAQMYFQAVPKSWGISKEDAYPEQMIELSVGRQHALSAYSRLREKRDQGLADGTNIV
jgi:deoxyribodipyrimidine photo-lyase